MCYGAMLLAMAMPNLALPQLQAPNFINLGSSIVVHFKVSDGQDGRGQHSPRDWIGLYKKGSCEAEGPHLDDYNKHYRHQCFLQVYNIPYDTPSGTVTFSYAEYGGVAGEFDVRYFYGDDPTVPGNYHWVSQGYVCHSWFAPDVTDDPALQEDVGSNSGESVTVVDAKLGGNATIEVVSTPYGDVSHGGLYRGVQGMSNIQDITLAECQCDPDTVQSDLKIHNAFFRNKCYEPVNNYIDTPGPSTPAAPLSERTVQVQAEVLSSMAQQCDGLSVCNYNVNYSTVGVHHEQDVASWCSQEFVVDYTCTGGHPLCSAGQQENLCRVVTNQSRTDTRGDQVVSLSCPQSAARQQCLAKRAACGRCSLDAVARAGPIVVMGAGEGEYTHLSSEYTAWQNTESLPGFEVAVN